MAQNASTLKIVIGAALGSGFTSVLSKGTEGIKKIGSAVKDIATQSKLSGGALAQFHARYSSLMASMRKQEVIAQKRAYYRGQIMEIIGLTAALAAPIKKAMEFEKAMDGVRSVVNFKEPNGLKKLGNVLSEMSTTLPVSATELANIAAVGGRFGVDEKQLGAFAEKVGRATFTWGFAAEEGAEKISNLMKIMNWSTADLDKHFDTLNELGNRTGATANEIVRSIIKSAAGLSSFKFSTAEIGALVSTFKSMGQTAEEAGSTLNTVLQKLSVTGSLGKAGQNAFHRMGIGVHAFAEEVGKSPQTAIMKLLEGLAKLDDVTRRTALNDIFGKRAAMNVGMLVNHLKIYKENLHAATNMKNVNGSFWTDYSHAAGTAFGSLKTFLYSLENVTRKIGDILIGPFKGFLSTVTDGLNKLSSFMDKNGALVKNIVFGIGALAGLKIGIFALGYASTFLFGGFNRLIIAGKALMLGLTGAGVAGRGLLAGFLKLVGVTGGVSAGLLALSEQAEGGVVFSFGIFINRIKWLTGIGKTKIASFFKSMKGMKLPDVFNGFKRANMSMRLGAFKTSIADLGQLAANIGVAIAGFLLSSKLVGGALRSSIRLLRGTLSIAGAGLKTFGSLLRFTFGFVRFGVTAFGALCQISWFFATNVLPFVFGSIKAFGSGLWSLSKTVIPLVIRGLSAIWGMCAANPLIATGVVIAGVAYLIYKNWSPIKEFFIRLWNEPQQVWSDFKDWIGETWDTVVDQTETAIGKFSEFFDFLKFGSKFVRQVGSILGDVWENVTAVVDNLYFGGDSVIPIWESVKNFFKNIWTDVAPSWNVFLKCVEALNVGEKIKAGWEKLKTYLKNFFDWIKGPLETFFQPLSGMFDKFKGWLPEIGGEKAAPVDLKKLPDIGRLKTDVTRNQNNNFTITINAAKNDNAESLSQKIVSRISEYSKTFLYDAVPEVI